jgi:hypothetical protein
MTQDQPQPTTEKPDPEAKKPSESPPAEKESPKRLDPTRYQDWEKGGRCIDF